MADSNTNSSELKHHKQLELCTTRPAYRQGRKLTAVKVYTINNESTHLYVYGVPSINLRSELKNVFNKYGQLKSIHATKDVETEAFTECFHVNFERIQSARIAKKFVDNKNFFGGVLHVCYAPEKETIEETMTKLLQRRKDVLTRLPNKTKQQEEMHKVVLEKLDMSKLNRKRKHPALEITNERLRLLDPEKVWKDIPKQLDPRLIPEKRFKNVMDEPTKHYQIPVEKQIYGPLNIRESSKYLLNLGECSKNEGESQLNIGESLKNKFNLGETSKNIEESSKNKLNHDYSSPETSVKQCDTNTNKLVPSVVIKSMKNTAKKQILFHKKRKFDLV